MAGMQAKAGGQTVGGKFFKGGQFIGMEYIDRENGIINIPKIQKAVDRSIYRNIRHAAYSIRKYIQQSVKRSGDPSAPGEPVATRGRRGNVKNSIFAAVENDNAIIGPRYSFVGVSMEAHEFGKSFHGQEYPARPTSGPALDANKSRFAASFAGSIGE